MNTITKKVFGTVAILSVLSVVGFTSAYGYGSSSTKRTSGGGARPVVTTAAENAGEVLGETSYTFTTFMKVGSRGAEVSELQKFLNTKGANLVVDGVFGPLTKAAVVKFQADNALTADGIVGPLTRAVLNK